MVNELNNLGMAYARTAAKQAAESVAQAGGKMPEAVGQANASLPNPEAQEVKLGAAASELPDLLDAKEGLEVAVKNARDAGKALDQVDVVLQQIQEKISSVKNYPPFPAGNEERVQYLNSIDGLRKELQAMTIPPVSGAFPPVFYPQEDKFPPLDAKVPSDAAVLAFGEAALGLQKQVQSARAMLDAQMDKMYADTIPQLPKAPSEPDVPVISAAASAQLAGVKGAIAGSSDILAQLGS